LKTSKVKIEIFFPFGKCACAYTPLMEKVGRVTAGFKEKIDVAMRSTASKEAKEYGIKDCCIVVNGATRLSADVDEKALEQVILQSNANAR